MLQAMIIIFVKEMIKALAAKMLFFASMLKEKFRSLTAINDANERSEFYLCNELTLCDKYKRRSVPEDSTRYALFQMSPIGSTDRQQKEEYAQYYLHNSTSQLSGQIFHQKFPFLISYLMQNENPINEKKQSAH